MVSKRAKSDSILVLNSGEDVELDGKEDATNSMSGGLPDKKMEPLRSANMVLRGEEVMALIACSKAWKEVEVVRSLGA